MVFIVGWIVVGIFTIALVIAICKNASSKATGWCNDCHQPTFSRSLKHCFHCGSDQEEM